MYLSYFLREPHDFNCSAARKTMMSSWLSCGRFCRRLDDGREWPVLYSLVRFWSCRNGKSWQITEKQYIGRNTRNSFHGLIFGHCWLAHRLCDWTATDWWDTDLIFKYSSYYIIISHHSGMVPFRSGSLSFYARHDCPWLEANHGQSNDAFVIGQVMMVVFQTNMSSFFFGNSKVFLRFGGCINCLWVNYPMVLYGYGNFMFA